MEPPYKLFTSHEQLRTIDTRRVIYVVALVLSFVVTEIGRHVYRPIIYQNGINDFGLADSIGNLGGIIAQVFLGLALMNPNLKQGIRVIGFLIIGYIFYEIVQPILPKGTFDWKDVFGTILGGVLAGIAFFMIQKYFKNNRIIFKL
jgi:glycopeptide antibiotics resistance protein